MKEFSAAQKMIGDLAHKLVELTDNVLFGDVWKRPGLSKRDRSLVTVSAAPGNHRDHVWIRYRPSDTAASRSEQPPGTHQAARRLLQSFAARLSDAVQIEQDRPFAILYNLIVEELHDLVAPGEESFDVRA